jgi:hypothetical protein
MPPPKLPLDAEPSRRERGPGVARPAALKPRRLLTEWKWRRAPQVARGRVVFVKAPAPTSFAPPRRARRSPVPAAGRTRPRPGRRGRGHGRRGRAPARRRCAGARRRPGSRHLDAVGVLDGIRLASQVDRGIDEHLDREPVDVADRRRDEVGARAVADGPDAPRAEGRALRLRPAQRGADVVQCRRDRNAPAPGDARSRAPDTRWSRR